MGAALDANDPELAPPLDQVFGYIQKEYTTEKLRKRLPWHAGTAHSGAAGIIDVTRYVPCPPEDWGFTPTSLGTPTRETERERTLLLLMFSVGGSSLFGMLQSSALQPFHCANIRRLSQARASLRDRLDGPPSMGSVE